MKCLIRWDVKEQVVLVSEMPPVAFTLNLITIIIIFLHLITYQGIALLEKVILKIKSSTIWAKKYAERKYIVINQVVQQVNFQNIILIAGQPQTEQLHQRFHWMKYRIQTGEQLVTLLGLNHSRHRLDTLSHLYSFKWTFNRFIW